MYLKSIVIHLAVVLFSITFYSCSLKEAFTSRYHRETTYTTKQVANIQQREKSFYMGITQDNEGIKYFNTKEDSSKLILQLPKYVVVNSKISPDKKKLIFSFYDTKEKKTKLYVLFIENQKLLLLKNNKGHYSVDIFWDNDSLLISNFTVWKKNKKQKYNILKAYTEIINVNTSKVLKGFKPRKGAILENYIQNKYLVYADYKGYYLINKKNNKLIKTLYGFNLHKRKHLTFSPNGKYLFYIESRKVIYQFGNSHNQNELFLANFKGQNSKLIIGFKYNPKNIEWSPASDQIICDIASQKWSNIRHIAFYNISTNRTIHREYTGYKNMPNFTNNGLSPSGKYILAWDRIESQTFPLREQYFIYNVNSGDFKRLTYDNGGTIFSTKDLGGLVRWWEDNILLFGKKYYMSAYNLSNNTITFFPSDRWYLFFKEIK